MVLVEKEADCQVANALLKKRRVLSKLDSVDVTKGYVLAKHLTVQ